MCQNKVEKKRMMMVVKKTSNAKQLYAFQMMTLTKKTIQAHVFWFSRGDARLFTSSLAPGPP